MAESEEGAATAEEQAAPEAHEEGSKPKKTKKPAKKRPDRNWTLIALITVSILAALLLASTITLAATGDFGHCGRGNRFEQCGCRCGPGQMYPMDRGWRQRRGPWQQDRQFDRQFERRKDQAQPPQDQSVPVPQSQTAPTPGQGL